MDNDWKNIKPGRTPSTSSIDLDFLKRITNNSKVLEIGSGSGRIINILNQKDCSIVAIDINTNEISILKHKYSNNRKIIFLNFNIINDDFKNPNLRNFDFVFMNGLLGSLGKLERNKAIDNVSKIVNKNTLMHISEFLLFEENPEMKVRYKTDFLETTEYGSFYILDSIGDKIGITHNFNREELVSLVEAKFKIVNEFKQDFISYTGKVKPGIILIVKLK